MNLKDELAMRLLQSVQGCTIHLHGPIQAWLAIIEAEESQKVNRLEILRLITENSEKRIESLVNLGASEDDPRIKKERISITFMKKLLE